MLQICGSQTEGKASSFGVPAPHAPPQSLAYASGGSEWSAAGEGTLHLIALNALLLLKAIRDSPPHMAHYAGSLIANLLRDLKPDAVWQLLRIPETTLSKARRDFPVGDLGELLKPYAANVHRHRIASAELAAIRDFIKEQCVPKSGTRREHYEQLLTSKELFARYRQTYAQLLTDMVVRIRESGEETDDPALQSLLERFRENEKRMAFLAFMQTTPTASPAFGGGAKHGPKDIVFDYLLEGIPALAPPAAHSSAVFSALKHELPLTRRHGYWGQWDCKTCSNGKLAIATLRNLKSKLSLNAAQSAEMKKATKAAETYEWHLLVMASQRDAFAALKPPYTLMDFSSYTVAPNVSDKSLAQFRTMVFCVERPGHRRLFVDVLCADRETQQGDYFYERAALLALFFEYGLFDEFDEVVLGADDQFRSRFMAVFYGGLQAKRGKPVRALFRCAHHGRNLCDAHVGLGQRAVDRYLKCQELLRAKPELAEPGETVSLSPLSTAEELAAVLRHAFEGGKNDYLCVTLKTVPRVEKLKPKVRPIHGLQRVHEIGYESGTVALLKHLSSDKEADRIHLRLSEPWSILPADGSGAVSSSAGPSASPANVVEMDASSDDDGAKPPLKRKTAGAG